ncbi:MAG: hydrogenase nickel incorporation protein HypB [Pseudomonadota bacterium]|nr:hydrogenase nickel incorporation protein HypB [Pseudomonadota bacterium]
MCDTCGCTITQGNQHLIQNTAEGKETISVLKHVLSANDHQAQHNRAHFDQQGVLALNLMSSPGSGKTLLLEATIAALKAELTLAVIEGDLETENDAARIRKQGVETVQIVTGSACHLDAHLVHQALHHLDLATVDIVFIENVGNLVCPASFDLGHHRNVTLLSVTEGDDKPAKYPVMFRAADLVVLTKTDLLPVLDDFEPQRAEHYLRQLANPAPFIPLSAKKATGMNVWLDWVRQEVAAQRQRRQQGQTALPAMQPDGIRLHHADNQPEPHHHVTHA